MAVLRGVEQHQEQDPRLLLRDTRTLGQRISDFLDNPLGVSATLVILATTGFIIPGLADLLIISGVVLFLCKYSRHSTLPFRLPLRSQADDYNDIKPGTKNKPRKGQGICFFGNDKVSNEELWFSNDDMRTHVLIFGSTGAGKTEALCSFAFNALVQGSGFIYVDGKGDNTLFSKIFSMARCMGREDDLLTINFMTGARDVLGPQKNRLSNTLNPFAEGSSSMLTNLIVSLMDSSSSSSDGDMWKGRAISFVEALMKLLTYARDQGYILLDANSIRYYFTLDKLEEIVIDKKMPRYNQESIDIADAPPIAVEPVQYYCSSLPGFSSDPAKKGKQTNQCQEQHGFIIMQLTRAFTSLADTYGHILRTNLAEVDLHDVILNRRILVVLLPALEKSPDELSNLGKVIIATLKAMMASGLGSEVEGDYRDLILRKPTNAETPYMCILDEYGYYSVEGFAVVPAQARSLGFSAIFAGQDLPAFQKVSKEEAMSIGANTNIKICMKLEDPMETWEFFQKTAGEAYVTKVDHFQTNTDSITNTYQDTRSSSYEKRARVDLLDLKDQGLGEAHIFFKSRIVRAKTFFADPKPVKRMRLNQFLRVEPPKDELLEELEMRFKRFNSLIEQPVLFDQDIKPAQEITKIEEIYHSNQKGNLIKKGVSALLGYHDRYQPARPQAPKELTNPNEMNIFTSLRKAKRQLTKLLVDDEAAFSRPILSGETTVEYIEAIERVSGKTADVSSTVAAELSKDIQKATHYPPVVKDVPSPADLAGVAYAIAEGVSRKVQEEKEKAKQKNKGDKK